MARKKSPTRRLRDALGLSMLQLARETGITRQRIWQLENGSHCGQVAANVLWGRFREDFGAIGISLEELLGFDSF